MICICIIWMWSEVDLDRSHRGKHTWWKHAWRNLLVQAHTLVGLWPLKKKRRLLVVSSSYDQFNQRLIYFACFIWKYKVCSRMIFFSYFFPALFNYLVTPWIRLVILSALRFSTIKPEFSSKVLLHHTHSTSSPLGTRRFDIKTQLKYFSLMT